MSLGLDRGGLGWNPVPPSPLFIVKVCPGGGQSEGLFWFCFVSCPAADGWRRPGSGVAALIPQRFTWWPGSHSRWAS